MEATLCLPHEGPHIPSPKEVLQGIKKTFKACSHAYNSFVNKYERKKKFFIYIQETLKEFHPLIESLDSYDVELLSPADQQILRDISRTSNGLLLLLERIYKDSRKHKFLTSAQNKWLKDIRKKLLHKVCFLNQSFARMQDFDLDSSMLSFKLNGRTLVIPLHIAITQDLEGWHVACLEFPQIYGFGDTQEEAVAMFDRESYSLYEELNGEEPLSRELEEVRNMLDRIYNDEK